MTGRGIAKAFALIANVYGKRFDIPTDPAKARLKAEVWADLLDDVPDELGLAAFRAYCQAHGDWPPTPADVRKFASANLELPTPGAAWAEVWEAARSHGYQRGRVPTMSHPEVAAAAKATPWFRICLANTEHDLSFAQRDFMAIYEGLCARTEREVARAQIGGRALKLLPRLKRIDEAIAGSER
jgi:hypothetical protein